MNYEKTNTPLPLENVGAESNQTQNPAPVAKMARKGGARKKQTPQQLLKEIREQLHYNPETGALTWIIPPIGWISIGSDAGSKCKTHGYVSVKIGGWQYRAHRLIWLWMTGEIPQEVDHINRQRSDNRWCNLREVTRRENMFNKSPYKKQSNLPTGVFFDKRKQQNPYGTQLQYEGKRYYFGYYKTAEEAKKAFESARTRFFKEFAPT